MAEKLTVDFIRKEFEKAGGRLLSTVYKDAKTPLEYACVTPGCDGVGSISWSNFKKRGCSFLCPSCRAPDWDKRTEYVRTKLEAGGSELLAPIRAYKDQVLFKCTKCGKVGRIQYQSFLQGANPSFTCAECNPHVPTVPRQKVPWTESRARKFIEDHGGIYVGVDNLGISGTIRYICPNCGSEATISANMETKIGGRLTCANCRDTGQWSDSRRAQRYLEIKRLAEQAGATLLTEYYVNAGQEMKFICATPGCGREWTFIVRNLLKGENIGFLCDKCYRGRTFNPEGNYGKNRHLVDNLWYSFMKEMFALPNPEDYAAHHVIPFAVAPERRTSVFNGFPLLRSLHSAAYESPVLGKNPFHTNPLLATVLSYPEEARLPWETFDFVELNASLCSEIILETPSPSTLLDKKRQFEAGGTLYIPCRIDLVLDPVKRSILHSMLRNRACRVNPKAQQFYGVQQRHFMARNLLISELTPKQAAEFFNKSHIQGNTPADIIFGLKTPEGEIVQAISFGRPRFSQSYDWELLRLSTALDTVVVGGAGRLFRAFIRAKQPQSIVSYQDLQYSYLDPEKAVYSQLGFKFSHVAKPGYRYFRPDLNRSFSRVMLQKHKLKKILPCFDASLSEAENLAKAGYIRIYDCGNNVFVWTK